MGFLAYSKKPINFPKVCINCQSESHKEISSDVKNKKTREGLSSVASLTVFGNLKHVGNSVKVPICRTCLGKLNKYRFALVLLLMCSGLSLYIALQNKMDDISSYLFFGGIASIAFWPMLYLYFKTNLTKTIIEVNDDGYIYQFGNNDYWTVLEKEIEEKRVEADIEEY